MGNSLFKISKEQHNKDKELYLLLREAGMKGQGKSIITTRSKGRKKDIKKSRLEVILSYGNLLAITSYLNALNLVIFDEVVSSSKDNYNKEVWRDYLSNLSSDNLKVWQEIKHCKGSLKFIYAREIQIQHLKLDEIEINQDFFEGNLHFPTLLSASFRGCHSLDDASLRTFASMTPALRGIDLYCCYNITDFGLVEMSKLCRGICKIDIGRCSALTNTGVKKMAANLAPSLKEIDIGNDDYRCENLTDSCVIFIAQTCLEIQRINLRGCVTTITDISMIALSKLSRKLQSINLRNCENLTDNAIIELSKGCTELEDVNIRSLRSVTDVAVLALSKNLKKLSRLNIRGCFNVTTDCKNKLEKLYPRIKVIKW